MKEIKILGRGGQGVVSASAVLASAFFREGYHTHAFPMYGVERAGGPARSFVRVDKKPINRYDQIYAPFVMLVIDTTILKEEIESELKTAGLMIINSIQSEADLRKQFNLSQTCVIRVFDAKKMALDTMGKPFANVPMIGAFAGITNLVSLKSLNEAIAELWEGKGEAVIKANQEAVKKAYDLMACKKCKVEL